MTLLIFFWAVQIHSLNPKRTVFSAKKNPRCCATTSYQNCKETKGKHCTRKNVSNLCFRFYIIWDDLVQRRLLQLSHYVLHVTDASVNNFVSLTFQECITRIYNALSTDLTTEYFLLKCILTIELSFYVICIQWSRYEVRLS